MSLAEHSDQWSRACLAAALLHADPKLPGVVVKSRAGAVRDAYINLLPLYAKRVHASVGAEALLGGIDLSATLSSGTLVKSTGVIQPNTCLMVTMAERLQPQTAAILAQALDEVPGLRLILLDEGIEEDEEAPDCLLERLPFWIDLNDIPSTAIDVPTQEYAVETLGTPREEDFDAIAEVSTSFGVKSARAQVFAVNTSLALAAMRGVKETNENDIETACVLTLAHKATRLPESTEGKDDKPEPETLQSSADDTETMPDIPQELLLEAVLSALPSDLLNGLTQSSVRGAKGSGAGAKSKGNRRGRPLPAMAGRPSSEKRIDLYATLRAAAPWQTIRKRETCHDGPHIRASDLRVKRYEQRSDRLIIFAVDASGSSAISRLAEAKGAIELLLGEAYARRDHVALISFRGKQAEVLLPPTRSLVQTKRRLAELPGGGGTPLASGMETALGLALNFERRGMTPTVCVLTDGRANIDRKGDANRTQAMSDAEAMAKQFHAHAIEALVIDTGARPERKLKELAVQMRAQYLAMPRADAERLSRAIEAAT